MHNRLSSVVMIVCIIKYNWCDIDYIRVLGFTTKGQEYLSKIKKNITISIITGYKKNISKVLDIEYRVTKIYSLFTSANLIKKEYQIKPIIKENND